MKVEIINMLRDKIKLKNNNYIIDINNNDDMVTLYNMIKLNTGLINIRSMIINDNYVWTNIFYKYFDLPDNSDDDEIENKNLNDYNLIKIYRSEPKISSILGEDYNKDYVTVQLILFSHIHYINHISSKYMVHLHYFHIHHMTEPYYNHKRITRSKFEEAIDKLNDDSISFYDYEQIKRFLKRRLKMYNFNEEDSKDTLSFLINEIQKKI